MKYKNFYKIFSFLALSVLVLSCRDEEWDTHYKSNPATVNVKMWDAIKNKSAFPQYSKFVDWVIKTGLDSVLETNQSFTLFIPTNDAFDKFNMAGNDSSVVLGQLISETVLQPANISSWRKLLMINTKYVLVSKVGADIYFNGIKVEKRSQLYKDGLYFELGEVPTPLLNLYQYLAISSPVVRNYIDGLDSLGFDPLLCNPIGFDSNGNTIYDSSRVTGRGFVYYNSFLDHYFKVGDEFRNKSATLLVFNQEQYNAALDTMAKNLGGVFTDYTKIPQDWQKEVLLPFYLNSGIFDSTFTNSRFDTLKSKAFYKNINGDSVIVNPSNVDLNSRFECSNGVVYNYKKFIVPTNLYNDTLKIEGESLVVDLGASKFAWKTDVKVSDAKIETTVDASDPGASKSRQLLVKFASSYSGPYSVEFNFHKVFPRTYKLLWQASNRPSGKVAWYVNDIKVGEYDNDKWGGTTPFIALTGELAGPKNGTDPLGYAYNSAGYRLSKNKTLNYVEFVVQNVITEYGDAKIKCVWNKGQGSSSSRGLLVDVVMLVPYKK